MSKVTFSLRRTIELAHGALTAAEIDHALIGGLALATLGIDAFNEWSEIEELTRR